MSIYFDDFHLKHSKSLFRTLQVQGLDLLDHKVPLRKLQGHEMHLDIVRLKLELMHTSHFHMVLLSN